MPTWQPARRSGCSNTRKLKLFVELQREGAAVQDSEHVVHTPRMAFPFVHGTPFGQIKRLLEWGR